MCIYLLLWFDWLYILVRPQAATWFCRNRTHCDLCTVRNSFLNQFWLDLIDYCLVGGVLKRFRYFVIASCTENDCIIIRQSLALWVAGVSRIITMPDHKSTITCRIFALLSPNDPCNKTLKIISLQLVRNRSAVMLNAPIQSGKRTWPLRNVTSPKLRHFLSDLGDSCTIKSAVINFNIIQWFKRSYNLSNN